MANEFEIVDYPIAHNIVEPDVPESDDPKLIITITDDKYVSNGIDIVNNNTLSECGVAADKPQSAQLYHDDIYVQIREPYPNHTIDESKTKENSDVVNIQQMDEKKQLTQRRQKTPGSVKTPAVEIEFEAEHKEFNLKQNTIRLREHVGDDAIIQAVANQLESLEKGVDSRGKAVKGSDVITNKTLARQHPAPNQSIEITKKLINMTYAKFDVLVDGQKPTPLNIVIFITYAIKLVEELTNMKKGRRVELILSVLRKYIDLRVDASETEKDMLHELLESALPLVYNAFSSGWAWEKIKKILLKCKCSCCK